MRTLSSYLRYGLLLPLFASLVAMLLLSSQPSTTVHATPSSGTGGPSFGLQPVLYDPSNPVTQSYFVFDSHPGSNLQNRVRVTNSGTATGTVQLYPADATSGQNGGIVYLGQNEPCRNVGAWLALDMQELTLAPGQSQVVPFTLNIPATVQAGQHIGGIVAESVSSNSTNQTHTLSIRVQNLSIVAVQINLPGKLIEGLTAADIQSDGANGYQNMSVGLTNTGNVMLKPYGVLQVIDTQNHILRNLPLKLDTLLPQTSINYVVGLQGQVLNVGNYTVVLTLTYGHEHTLYYTQAFTITQQQLTHIFKAGGPQQYTMPSTTVLLVAGIILLLAAGGAIFGGYSLCRVIVVSTVKRMMSKK